MTEDAQATLWNDVVGDAWVRHVGSFDATLAPFGDAVIQHPGYFSELYSNMVRAGESSGALDQVMVRLANFLQTQARLKNKVGAAMIYPMIMVIVGIVVVAILMTAVVPKVTQLLKQRKSVGRARLYAVTN